MMHPIRTAKQLIGELESEAADHWFLAMAVGLKGSTILVPADDRNRLALVKAAIKQGGVPIGVIAVEKTRNELTMRLRLYPEYPNSAELDAEGYLDTLSGQLRKLVKTSKRE